jgi:hypothetical protein
MTECATCSLHSFVTKSYKYGILDAMCKSWVGVRLGKLTVVQRTSFFRRCNFKRWLSNFILSKLHQFSSSLSPPPPPLAPQPNLGLDHLHKIRLNFLEASQKFSFLQGRVSLTPNPHPGRPVLCIYIPQGQGGPPSRKHQNCVTKISRLMTCKKVRSL